MLVVSSDKVGGPGPERTGGSNNDLLGDQGSWTLVGLTAVVGAFILVFIVLCNLLKRKPSSNLIGDGSGKSTLENEEESSKKGEAKKKEKPLVRKKDGKGGASFSHPWLACMLKAHSGPVLGLDFSSNGKYLASCSEDRTVLLWHVKEFNQKERRSVRGNVELDHLTKVRFSPDSKAFIGSLFNGDTVRVFKIGKKEDGTLGNIQALYDFPQKHSVEIINIGIASSGKFIMTCCSDTTIRIWDLKGELLSSIDSKQMNHTHGCVSPCGRFVASSGFTPDVKVWEVCFDKSGSFREVTRAFELKGHTASVYCFAFNSDSHRMASVSKDGTWRLWDTNVEYQKKQDPYLLYTCQSNLPGPIILALSPDARTVLLASGSSLRLYSTRPAANQKSSACHHELIEDVHTGPVTAIDFSVDSRYFVCAGDKQVNVFYNVAGWRSTVEELEEKKKGANTQALRERLQQQIDESLDLIKSVEDSSRSKS